MKKEDHILWVVGVKLEELNRLFKDIVIIGFDNNFELYESVVFVLIVADF